MTASFNSSSSTNPALFISLSSLSVEGCENCECNFHATFILSAMLTVLGTSVILYHFHPIDRYGLFHVWILHNVQKMLSKDPVGFQTWLLCH